MTFDWYLGVINHGQEKNHEPSAVTMITIIRGFLHLYKNITRLPESKSSFLLISFVIGSKIKYSSKVLFFTENAKSKDHEAMMEG
jgi:hypothetical protein